VEISHHRDASFRFRGNTVTGSIRNRSGGDIEVVRPEFGPGTSARGNYNGGEVTVEASSVSGSISLNLD
jgi:hypothetical protein